MIPRIIKSLYLLVVLLVFTTVSAQNLITNGDFESGGAGTGFQTNYILTASNSNPRNYAIVNNPAPINAVFSNTCVDHTSGSGKMMVVDGATSGPGNDKVWEALTPSGGGGGIPVTVGVTYTFSYWIQSIATTNNAGNSANIQVKINNVDINPIFGSNICSTTLCSWNLVQYSWTATSGYAQIWLYDRQTSFAGNDFALDDISFRAAPAPLSLTYSITNLSCINANDGTIFGYGVGGVTPYSSYALSGPTPTVPDPSGFFTGLAPGNYTLSVTDAAGTTFSQPGIIIPNPVGLTLTAANTSICEGGSTTLTATGGSTYTWSVNPITETVPSGSNPNVSPNGTATYTVNSTTVASDNLIYNGDFFLGNLGFTSDYNYYASNSGNVQKAYGVVSNPNAWEVGFTNCVDHTNGLGKMLVVDGSNVNAGNDKVWCQTIPVTPGQNYTLSYYAQTLSNPAILANIEVKINGISLGTALAPNVICSWGNVTYPWNSGANTRAEICFYDKNTTANGNDFAIDDIVFSRINTCVLPPKSVTINVIPKPVINASVTTQPSCTVPTGTITVSSPTGANYEYSIDGTNYQASTIFNGLTANNYPVTVRDITTNCVSSAFNLTVNPASGSIPNASATTGIAPNCGVKLIGNSTTSGVTIVWNGPGLAANSPNPSIATASGNYTVTVTDPVSTCSNTASVNVVLPTAPNAPSVLVTQPGCTVSTGSIVVTAPIGANYEYSIDGVSYQASPTFSLLTPANYSVTVRDTSTGCVSPITPEVLSPGTSLAPPGVVSPTYVCQTSIPVQPLTATVSPGATLLWYTTATGGTGSPTLTPSVATAGSTTYYVSQTNGTCESSRVPINVIVNAVVGSINIRCDATQVTTNPVTSVFFDWNNIVPPGRPDVYNYTYSINGGPLVSGSTILSSLEVFGVLPGQSCTLTLVSAPGYPCVTFPISNTCSNCSSTTTPTFTFSTTVCSGSVAPVLPTTSDNGISGTWSPNTISTTANANYTFTPNYTLFPCAIQVIKSITVTNPPTTVLAGPNVCVGSSTTFTSSTAGGTWSSANTSIATVNPSTGLVTGVSSGTVSIDYTFPAAGGCSAVTFSRSLTVSNPPSAGTLSGNQSICIGGNSTFFSTVSGGTWSSSNTAIATVNPSTGDITGISAGSANIKYEVTGSGGCSNVNVIRPITVNANVIPVFSAVGPICYGSPVSPLPLTSNNGITGTWDLPIDNTNTTTYTFSPTSGLCATTTQITIVVNQRVTPLFGLFPSPCQGDTPPVLPTSSNNTPSITGAWSPTTVNTTNLGTTVYTFTPTAGQCTSTVLTTLSLTVLPVQTPDFAPIPAFCDGFPAPTLATISPNGITGTWNPSTISNFISSPYIFTPTPGQCALTQTLFVNIIPRTVPSFATVPPFCKGSTAPILPLTSLNGISGTFSPAVVDNTVSGVFPYLFVPNPTECATTQTVYVEVTEPISPGFPDLAFCTGSIAPPLPAISPNGINGTWNPTTIDNTTTATYLFTPNTGECAIPQTLTVTVNQYTLVGITGIVTNYFEDNQVITVLATDAGNYLYQLDFGPLQESNIFYNVSSGTHVIKVVDANGCSSPLTEEVQVINYPKFFTPNDDSYNDTWNISGLADQSDSKIFIFDRYGKLLKQISPRGKGWDGTFNGYPLPSDDYWFLVEYEENGTSKEFKSHFALKR